MEDIKELFSPVIVEDDIAGLTFLHLDNEGLHRFIYLGVGQWFILIADMGDMRSFRDPVTILFADHNHVPLLRRFLKEITDGNAKSGGDFK